jgi:hypothetical protein
LDFSTPPIIVSPEPEISCGIQEKSKVLGGKAKKSSPLLGPFCGSEFWGFSLLKI